MATELAAGIAVAALQANQGADPREVILSAGAVVGALGVLWVLVRFLVRPMLHNWFFAVIAAEAVRTTETVVEAFDKSDRTRAMARGFVDRLYADKIASDTETKELAEANKDRLVFLEESMSRMGESLAKDMAAAVRENTKSNEANAEQNRQQTALMREIQREIQMLREREIGPLREAYVRLDERFNSVYDGPERRQKPRNRDDT